MPNDSLLSELENTFKKCSDCLLHPDYIANLNKLRDIELSQELIDYLCDKATSKKHIWEIRFEHLRVLLLNPSAKAFDLKEFYCENSKKCRRLAMKLFFIRGYALYASEKELIPITKIFQNSLLKNHDYIDYSYLLSAAGLPYLVSEYGYPCFVKALTAAKEEYEQIDPLLRGFFTLNAKLEAVNLVTPEEAFARIRQFSEKCRNRS